MSLQARLLVGLLLLALAASYALFAERVSLLSLNCATPVARAARSPFAIAGREGAGAAAGVAGVILAWQNKFHQELQSAAKAIKDGGGAFWTLAAASVAYGVFHAAGPGHGKAVLASYMIASRAAVGRGMILAACAALLQGLVAIALVGAAAALFGATAQRMSCVSNGIEIASYAAVALLGATLVWKKGKAFLAALRAPRARVESNGSKIYCEAVDDLTHVHTDQCGHILPFEPASLDRGVIWTEAIGAIVAAGLRPCSGAILILVFTLSQGVFWAGVAAVLLMSAGTALSTGALAAFTVIARDLAKNWSQADARWAVLAGRGLELAAAVLVLGLGLTLLTSAAAV